ncbi:MAG: hypothetical protein V3R87_00170 [Dehalococcoidia bacterium]
MRLLKRLEHKRRIVRRNQLARSVVGGTGLCFFILFAFGLSGIFPPLAIIGMPIVILGAIAGTVAVLSVVGAPLGMLIY